jgi:protein involved in polysaccharide export with SLBB domain
LAQNSSPSQEPVHQEEPVHQQDPSKELKTPPIQPLASAEKTSRIETNSSALVLGPGDEVEITVYGTPMPLAQSYSK